MTKSPGLTLRRFALVSTLLSALVALAGCAATTTYRPDYVHVLPTAPAEQIDGKALVYMPASDEQFIHTSGATTFTGSGMSLSVPVGLMTREIAKTVYGAAFKGGAEFRNEVGDASGFRVVIQPRVADFKYFYHQLENAGFAITPGVQIILDVALLDAKGTVAFRKSYARPERKAGSYVVNLDPEEKISRLAHEEISETMVASLADIRTWLAAQAAP